MQMKYAEIRNVWGLIIFMNATGVGCLLGLRLELRLDMANARSRKFSKDIFHRIWSPALLCSAQGTAMATSSQCIELEAARLCAAAPAIGWADVLPTECSRPLLPLNHKQVQTPCNSNSKLPAAIKVIWGTLPACLCSRPRCVCICIRMQHWAKACWPNLAKCLLGTRHMQNSWLYWLVLSACGEFTLPCH